MTAIPAKKARVLQNTEEYFQKYEEYVYGVPTQSDIEKIDQQITLSLPVL